MSRPGRLIPLHAGAAAENMSIDQALQESVEADGVPVLRLYTWSHPTLSLGYFQKLADRDGHAESHSLDCVRRSTGGGAIVHDCELTYSLAVPIDPAQAGPRLDLYQQTHAAITEALAGFGLRAAPFRDDPSPSPTAGKAPFLCFQRRTDEDLIVSGYKVLGSAQRKSRRAMLQHGSLLLSASRWAPQLPGLSELGGRPIPLAPLAQAVSETIGQALQIDWTAGEISAHERIRAGDIEAEKFAANRWLCRR